MVSTECSLRLAIQVVYEVAASPFQCSFVILVASSLSHCDEFLATFDASAHFWAAFRMAPGSPHRLVTSSSTARPDGGLILYARPIASLAAFGSSLFAM